MAVILGLLLVVSAGAFAEDKAANGSRYGVALDAKSYPQTTAKEAFASVVKAIQAKKFDYLVAHLADPTFVDNRVKRLYGGRFEEQVADTRARLDPLTVKILQRFLKDGKWEEDKDRATVKLKDNERCVSFKKTNGRWFMEHGSKPQD
jgi:hypothetical protein